MNVSGQELTLVEYMTEAENGKSRIVRGNWNFSDLCKLEQATRAHIARTLGRLHPKTKS